MSTVRFQDQLGEALRHHPELYSYHPPDGMKSQYKPSDWIVCYHGQFILVEAKQCRTPNWPFSEWQPQQQHFCKETLKAGGQYLLVINWRKAIGVSSAESTAGWVDGQTALQLKERRGSIGPADVRGLLHWVGAKNHNWDVSSMFDPAPTHLLSSVS